MSTKAAAKLGKSKGQMAPIARKLRRWKPPTEVEDASVERTDQAMAHHAWVVAEEMEPDAAWNLECACEANAIALFYWDDALEGHKAYDELPKVTMCRTLGHHRIAERTKRLNIAVDAQAKPRIEIGFEKGDPVTLRSPLVIAEDEAQWIGDARVTFDRHTPPAMQTTIRVLRGRFFVAKDGISERERDRDRTDQDEVATHAAMTIEKSEREADEWFARTRAIRYLTDVVRPGHCVTVKIKGTTLEAERLVG